MSILLFTRTENGILTGREYYRIAWRASSKKGLCLSFFVLFYSCRQTETATDKGVNMVVLGSMGGSTDHLQLCWTHIRDATFSQIQQWIWDGVPAGQGWLGSERLDGDGHWFHVERPRSVAAGIVSVTHAPFCREWRPVFWGEVLVRAVLGHILLMKYLIDLYAREGITLDDAWVNDPGELYCVWQTIRARDDAGDNIDALRALRSDFWGTDQVLLSSLTIESTEVDWVSAAQAWLVAAGLSVSRDDIVSVKETFRLCFGNIKPGFKAARLPTKM